MPKIDLEAIPQTNRTGYPDPYDRDVAGRWYRRLAPSSGLTAMGASHVVLKPGAWSSQRHWHAEEDELLVMLSGEAVLVEDGTEIALRAGDVAAWPKGVRNGHHLQNRSQADCSFVAVSAGDSARDWGEPGHRPDVRRRRLPAQGRKALPAPLIRPQATSNCSITHCSSSAAWIHSCIQSCSHTACM